MNLNLKFAGVIEFAATNATVLSIKITIDGVGVRKSHVDTGSSFSMVSLSLYPLHVSKRIIQSFEKCALNIVGVGGLKAKFSKFIDVSHEIVKVEVANHLLVVSILLFLNLIETDILRRNNAIVFYL